MKFKIQFQINLTWNHYADILFTDVAVKCQPMPTVTSAPRHTHRAKTIALQRITIPVPLTPRLDRTKFWEPAGLTVKRLLVQQQGRSRLNKVLFVHIWNDEHYVHVQFISSVLGRDQWTIQSVRSRCPRVEKLLNTHGCHIKQDIWLTERINQYKDKPDTVKMAIFM